jgi:hypothetical protein
VKIPINKINKVWFVIILTILIGSIFLFFATNEEINSGWVYKEKINGFSRSNFVTYDIDFEHKFILKQNFSINQNLTDFEQFRAPTVEFTTVNPTKDGTQQRITEPLKPMNFLLTVERIDNQTIKQVSFEPLMFRNIQSSDLSVYLGEERNFFFSDLNQEWNRRNRVDFFNTNISYNETKTIDGKQITFIVHTELSTNTDPDTGRTMRAAIHTIKRTVSGEIVHQLSHTLTQFSTLQNLMLVFNQPNLYVPMLFLLTYIFIKVYNKAYDLKKNYRIKIEKR